MVAYPLAWRKQGIAECRVERGPRVGLRELKDEKKVVAKVKMVYEG